MFENEIAILSQFDVIKEINGFWVINSDYIDYIEQIQEGVSHPMTKKQLEDVLREQERIGSLAEDFTVEYEKRRLRKNMAKKLLRILQSFGIKKKKKIIYSN